MDSVQLKGLLSHTGYELSSSLSVKQGRAWMALMIHASYFLPLQKVHEITMEEYCERIGMDSQQIERELAVREVLESLMRVSAYRSDQTSYFRHTLITWFSIEEGILRYSLDGAFLHRVLPIITRSN